MEENNRIERVAIVGASGRIGGYFAQELLKTGKHTITAITHKGSKGRTPSGVKTAKVDYSDDGTSLVAALQGQQFLVITLGVRAPPELHGKIVAAAAKAGVPYVMPNLYGTDFRNESLGREDRMKGTLARVARVEGAGVPYIAMVCGFWYEWSLATGEQWYGFDIKARTVTLYDDGNTRVNTSTWGQCARALAALLSLPEGGASPAVSDWRNRPLYLSSFRVSQRDILESLHRVLGTTDADWAIRHEGSAQRYRDGLAEMQRGMLTGQAKAMYARVFYPNGDGDFESRHGLVNGVLGLPEEDLDEATARAVEMVESGWNPFAL